VPKLLAILQTSAGIGIAIGGLLISKWGGFNRRVLTMLTGDVILGISLIMGGIITLLKLPMLLIAPLFLAGLSLAISNSSSAAITQSKIPQNDIGKVSGASVSLSQLMIPVGLTVAIPITHLIGITGWYIFGGILNIIVVVISVFEKEFINYSLRNDELKPTSTAIVNET
jgi:hypothetical protein